MDKGGQWKKEEQDGVNGRRRGPVPRHGQKRYPSFLVPGPETVTHQQSVRYANSCSSVFSKSCLYCHGHNRYPSFPVPVSRDHDRYSNQFFSSSISCTSSYGHNVVQIPGSSVPRP